VVHFLNGRLIDLTRLMKIELIQIMKELEEFKSMSIGARRYGTIIA
jgi:hypothetical protein